jgi:hypothetical protein
MTVIDVQKMSSAMLQPEPYKVLKMAHYMLGNFIDFDTFFKWNNHFTSIYVGIPISYQPMHHNGTDLNQYFCLVMDLHPSRCVLFLVVIITLMTSLSKKLLACSASE